MATCEMIEGHACYHYNKLYSVHVFQLAVCKCLTTCHMQDCARLSVKGWITLSTGFLNQSQRDYMLM